jgi:hypothetical protein
MIGAFKNILIGVCVFAAVNAVLGSTIMTGTDAGTVLIKSLLSLVVAFGVIFAAFKILGSGK